MESETRGRSGALAAFLLPPATVVSSLIGFALGARWLLPIANSLPASAALLFALRGGRRRLAVALLSWWALWLALSSILLTRLWPERAEQVIFNGPQYRDEMFRWITTGVGAESSPALFVPQHLQHAALFCLAALISGGILALVMGAALLNYMAFYVGEILSACSASGHGMSAVLIAWNPWSIVRVASFIVLGVILAEPLLARLSIAPSPPAPRGRWLMIAGAGLIADMALKAWLAPSWPGLLSGCLD